MTSPWGVAENAVPRGDFFVCAFCEDAPKNGANRMVHALLRLPSQGAYIFIGRAMKVGDKTHRNIHKPPYSVEQTLNFH
jgi:hypothetical protein